ncbi:hypothetical protein [Microbacterium deminutum]|uniref:Capsular polysaccharide biosynthesis protein n=1 Tax=Microbacterium deminutum TaxID=344164 RepID=A0ABN2QK88_9MICO
MTIRDIWQAIVRRWYAVVAVFAIVAGLTFYFGQNDGLYTTRTVVSFSVPGPSDPLEQGGSRKQGVITFAAALAREINDGREPTRYASADAPLYGAGIRQGVLVGLPDTGGQWGVFYSRADIEIQIVGPTYEWVEHKQQTILAKVRASAEAQQRAVNVPDASFFSSAVEPITLKIDHVAPSRTAKAAAMAAMAVVAILIGGWAALTWDRIMRRRMEQATLATRPTRPAISNEVML